MIALRASVRRSRRSLAIVLAVTALGLTVAWAHSGPAADHMGAPVTVCLAVLDGVAVAGAALALAPRGRRRGWLLAVPALPLAPPSVARSPRPVAARAGPPLLQVFRL